MYTQDWDGPNCNPCFRELHLLSAHIFPRPRSARVLASSTGSITLAGSKRASKRGGGLYEASGASDFSSQAWDIPESTGCTELERGRPESLRGSIAYDGPQEVPYFRAVTIYIYTTCIQPHIYVEIDIEVVL